MSDGDESPHETALDDHDAASSEEETSNKRLGSKSKHTSSKDHKGRSGKDKEKGKEKSKEKSKDKQKLKKKSSTRDEGRDGDKKKKKKSGDKKKNSSSQPKRRSRDSEDEEDEDLSSKSDESNSDDDSEEDLNHFENDGFLVDDDEIEEEVEEEGDAEENEVERGEQEDDGEEAERADTEDVGEKKKKKRKKTYSDKLDEDDELMLRENLHIEGSGKKHLKRIRKIEDVEENIDDNEEILDPQANADLDAEDQEDINDFIDDDEDEDGELQEGGDEENITQTHRQPSTQRRNRPLDGGDDVIADLEDFFGDDDIFDEGFDPYAAEDEVENVDQTLESIFDPNILEQSLATKADDLIREKDLPERFQVDFIDWPELSDLELQEEARWMAKKLAYSPTPGFVEKAQRLLTFMTQDNLEIPYIATYKRDVYVPDFTVNALWRMYDLHKQYLKMQKKKEGIRQSIESISTSHPELAEKASQYLDEAVDEVELEDVQKFITFFGPREWKMNQYKVFYNELLDSKLLEVARMMSISVRDFLENMEHETLHHEAAGLDNPPKEIVSEYISTYGLEKRYPKPQKALKDIRKFLALEIFFNPGIRKFLRHHFEKQFVVSTAPTALGKVTIDSCHPFQKYKYTKNRPFSSFWGNYDYLLICEAAKENLLTVTESIHDAGFINNLLFEHYKSTAVYQVADEWNKERRRMLFELRTVFLKEYFLKQSKQRLLQDSVDYLCSTCTSSIESMLMVKPYDFTQHVDRPWNSRPDDPLPLVILAACVEENSMDIVALNTAGRLVDNISLSALLKPVPRGRSDFQEDARISSEMQKLTDFLKTHRPPTIILGADNIKIRHFATRFERLQDQLRVEDYEIQVVYVKSDLSSIAAHALSYNQEFPSLTKNLRKCISLGRRVINPLLEFAVITKSESDILSLSAHSMQRYLPKKELLQSLERAFINAVGQVGVAFEELLNGFGVELLKYVSGLGRRKAGTLLLKLFSKDSIITSRDTLSKLIDGDVVSRNCCGFIKFPEPSDDDRSASSSIDQSRINEEENEEVLDKLCEKLCEIRKTSRASYQDLFRHCKVFGSLDRSKLSYDIATALGRSSCTEEVNFILRELWLPFGDVRTSTHELSTVELFYCLTGESPELFRDGSPTTLEVQNVLSSVVYGRLSNGLIGKIVKEDFSDDNFYEPLHQLVKKGDAINSKIIGIDYRNYEVSLTCKTSNLQNSTFLVEEHLGVHYDMYAEQEEIKKQAEKDQQNRQKTTFQNRTIRHPCFHNISYEEAEAQLQRNSVGDFIFRPSSKGPDKLSLSFKLRDDCIVHKLIGEEAREASMSVGKSLKLDGEIYKDLDEISVK
eukprot:TRINITY_DN514_c0_g4_i6.p1 TRINITY_DN514_c0_g4~~TRINITY_DN514_c0_g4_i6.p1  ORF type:complete len:1342 (+),score=356.30 TRINITY_DN514_c0_g4_i6:46-4071(+)